MTDGSGITRHRWRAPQDDGGLLESPPLRDAGDLAAANRAAIEASRIEIDGRPLSELRTEARRAVAAAADEFAATRLFLDASKTNSSTTSATAEGLWFVCGHQPALAHPGVWIKNIAAAVLARTHGGAGLNLIVDNDVIVTRSMAVPRGGTAAPSLASVPFDASTPARPGEDAAIGDLSTFEAFGERVSSQIEADWSYRPMLGDLWRGAAEVARRSGRLVDALTRVRIELERRNGISNRECPISRLAESDSFLHLVRHLGANAGAFRESHNRRLAEYRRLNRIRSRSHPVPDLAEQGDWCEVPLWCWRVGEAHRRRVFVRRVADRLELGDGDAVFAQLPMIGSLDPLRELAARGIRLRPRALTTTLFARLFLADLFIHGIGGAKYDELTDAIAADIFGVRMPQFLVLTGTRRLPIHSGPRADRGDWLATHRRIREARFNAEKLLGDRAPRALVAEKKRLIGELKRAPAGSRQEFGRRLHDVERALAERAAGEIAPLARRLESIERDLAANRVLRNREFAAVLHPVAAYSDWVAQIRRATTVG